MTVSEGQHRAVGGLLQGGWRRRAAAVNGAAQHPEALQRMRHHTVIWASGRTHPLCLSLSLSLSLPPTGSPGWWLGSRQPRWAAGRRRRAPAASPEPWPRLEPPGPSPASEETSWSQRRGRCPAGGSDGGRGGDFESGYPKKACQWTPKKWEN